MTVEAADEVPARESRGSGFDAAVAQEPADGVVEELATSDAWEDASGDRARSRHAPRLGKDDQAARRQRHSVLDLRLHPPCLRFGVDFFPMSRRALRQAVSATNSKASFVPLPSIARLHHSRCGSPRCRSSVLEPVRPQTPRQGLMGREAGHSARHPRTRQRALMPPLLIGPATHDTPRPFLLQP